MATTKTRSKKSSSGVATRCDSWGDRVGIFVHIVLGWCVERRFLSLASVGFYLCLDLSPGAGMRLKRDMTEAFSRRRHWPFGMKRYMASLYELDLETWQRVTDFLERAATIDPGHATGDGPAASVA